MSTSFLVNDVYQIASESKLPPLLGRKSADPAQISIEIGEVGLVFLHTLHADHWTSLLKQALLMEVLFYAYRLCFSVFFSEVIVGEYLFVPQ